MASKVECHCAGNPACKLCNGTKWYEYQPGPRGWMPFRCPTCAGKGTLPADGPTPGRCPTCRGVGSVDPADPPVRGMLDVIWKSVFGAT